MKLLITQRSSLVARRLYSACVRYLVYVTIAWCFQRSVFSWLKMWKRYRMHDCSKQIYLICARFADNSQMQRHHLFNQRAQWRFSFDFHSLSFFRRWKVNANACIFVSNLQANEIIFFSSVVFLSVLAHPFLCSFCSLQSVTVCFVSLIITWQLWKCAMCITKYKRQFRNSIRFVCIE